MLMRSTGLGPTELVAEVVDLRRRGDYLIIEMKTLEPVRWRIRGAMCLRDFTVFLRFFIKFSIITFFFNPWRWFRKAAPPDDF